MSETTRRGYIRCTPLQTASSVTEKKIDEGKSKWNLHLALGYLVIAAKSKFKFHAAVGCVILGAKLAVYLAGELQKSEFLSNRVQLPEKVVAVAAMSLLFGKSLYNAIKETKEVAELILYFIALYKETVDTATADRNKDTGLPSDTHATFVPSETDAGALSDTGSTSDAGRASETDTTSATGNASDSSTD